MLKGSQKRPSRCTSRLKSGPQGSRIGPSKWSKMAKNVENNNNKNVTPFQLQRGEYMENENCIFQLQREIEIMVIRSPLGVKFGAESAL